MALFEEHGKVFCAFADVIPFIQGAMTLLNICALQTV